jgi:cholesterol transport system auxiliary component
MRRGTRLLLAAATVALAACSLSRPPIERTSYLLAAGRDGAAAQAAKPVALKIRPLRAEPLFERREFLYRLDGERVQSDFYSEFAERPDAMVTSALIAWLRSARLFANVVEPGLPADTPYWLDGTIVALYGDLRDRANPAAVIAIQFYLVRSGAGSQQVLLDRVLQQRVEVQAATAQAIAQGYNEALVRILTELERELAALELG